MWSYFTPKDMTYNLRKGPIFGLQKTHSFYYNATAVQFCGCLIQNNLLTDAKSSDSLFEFKIKINPIQDGLFRGCSQMGGEHKGPLPKICDIAYNDGTWHSYTLPKLDPKII